MGGGGLWMLGCLGDESEQAAVIKYVTQRRKGGEICYPKKKG